MRFTIRKNIIWGDLARYNHGEINEASHAHHPGEVPSLRCAWIGEAAHENDRS
jgi:hypothetical protein